MSEIKKRLERIVGGVYQAGYNKRMPGGLYEGTELSIADAVNQLRDIIDAVKAVERARIRAWAVAQKKRLSDVETRRATDKSSAGMKLAQHVYDDLLAMLDSQEGNNND